jgi:hypothetical protein
VFLRLKGMRIWFAGGPQLVGPLAFLIQKKKQSPTCSSVQLAIAMLQSSNPARNQRRGLPGGWGNDLRYELCWF